MCTETPDEIPPRIPHLAKGGVVTKPTLRLIGEAGPEVVFPLRDPDGPPKENS